MAKARKEPIEIGAAVIVKFIPRAPQVCNGASELTI